MEEDLHEAKSTTIHPHSPHHYPNMIQPLHSSLKFHNKKITNKWPEMSPKCALGQPLDQSTKMRSLMHATCPIIYSWTMSPKNGLSAQTNMQTTTATKENKRDKRASNCPVFGHILLHGICLSSFQSRLLETGGGGQSIWSCRE